ncbi:uncharacterized protein LOC135808162 isoform X1 [Sycon ciliatum]|uniref:uncharacterized protein LOC135808162 isoform X1 n=1 Tax=Sycon ciliatum TaxID=27933 RepID=UPI0031F67684
MGNCSSKENPRAEYIEHWEVGMVDACTKDPCCCLLSLLCPNCASYALRQRALKGDMTRYRCCQGYCFTCCCKCHDCGEDKCPELCLCCEVTFCMTLSVLATRYTIQDEYNIQNTACDNCLIATVYCLQCLACILHFIPGVPDGIEEIVDLLADFVYWTVCACMQTQHKVELEKRELQAGQIGTNTQVVVTTQPGVITTQPGVGAPPAYRSPPSEVSEKEPLLSLRH